jgi:hypothetical protein
LVEGNGLGQRPQRFPRRAAGAHARQHEGGVQRVGGDQRLLQADLQAGGFLGARRRLCVSPAAEQQVPQAHHLLAGDDLQLELVEQPIRFREVAEHRGDGGPSHVAPGPAVRLLQIVGETIVLIQVAARRDDVPLLQPFLRQAPLRVQGG